MLFGTAALPTSSPLFSVTLMVTVITHTSHKNMERQKDELYFTERRWVTGEAWQRTVVNALVLPAFEGAC